LVAATAFSTLRRWLVLAVAGALLLSVAATASWAQPAAVVRTYDVTITGSGLWKTNGGPGYEFQESRTWTATYRRVRIYFNRSGLLYGGFGTNRGSGPAMGTEKVSLVYEEPPGTVCWKSSQTVPAQFSFSGAPYPAFTPTSFQVSIRSSIESNVPRPRGEDNCPTYKDQTFGARIPKQRVGQGGSVSAAGIGENVVGAFLSLPRQTKARLTLPLDRIQAAKPFSFSWRGTFTDELHHADASVRLSFAPRG
jgi:hypothetical protein